jgi:outer membrane protein TolC
VVEDLRQDVLLRTAQAHAALAASREQRLASERATAAARQRVEAESERFSSGFASAHTVVLAQQQQLATEENLLAALIKQQLSLVTLRRAVGSALQDWPTEGGGL